MKNNIKKLLKNKGVTQTWLTQRIDVSCSYLSLIVADKRDPDIDLAVRIADNLDVTLKEVFPQNENLQDEGKINRILLVDDDRDFCGIVDVILRNGGFTVKTASDGFEAGFQVPLFKPDLIILDILLEGLDGIAVCSLLRERYPDVKILGISASFNVKLKEKMLEAGANSFLSKPFDYPTLRKSIAELERTKQRT
jgi:CheY-like chemotaxis protein/DNA-binding XRE family transcriptional regulator